MSPNVVETLTNNARELFREILKSAILNTSGNPAKWAKEKRWLARGESPLSTEQPTKYAFEDTPWCEEICAEMVNPEVQKTVLCLASNLGKTACFLNALGWIVEDAPGHIIWALKTQDQMDEISQKTIDPFIQLNLENLFAAKKSRDSGYTVSLKLFAGGSLSMIGTESITGFRANRSPYVIGDEIDSWKGDVGGEGDPVRLLLKRSDGFGRSLRLLGSTPGTKGESRIWPELDQSDFRKWNVPCQGCGEPQIIMWKDIQWPQGEPEKAVWACPTCGLAHDDQMRRKSVRMGFWSATQPFSGVRGYWLNGLNSLFPCNQGFKDRLHQWAKEWIEANNPLSPEKAKQEKKVIIQTLFCELWEDEEDAKPDWAEIAARREKWDKIPKKVVWLIVGVDVHPDRIEATLTGWGRGEESWILEHTALKGDPRDPEVWGRLEGWVLKPREREDGCILNVRAVGVDTGHPLTQRMAYAFIRPRQVRNWFALKGSSQIEAPVIVRPKKSTTVDRVNLLTVGGHRIKGLIYDRAILVPPTGENIATPGTMHFHESLTDEWFQQLLAENSSPVWKNGVRYREFKKPTPNTRNEALDTVSYAYAAYVALGSINLNHDAEDARLLADKAEREKPQEQDATEQWEHPQHRGGFVGGGGWKI